MLFVLDLETHFLTTPMPQKVGAPGFGCFHWGWRGYGRERSQPTVIRLLEGFFLNDPLRETNSAKLH